jgi:hypothetical protein
MEETERLRDELHDIAMKKEINSPGAIRASQLLDIKVNEYYRYQRHPLQVLFLYSKIQPFGIPLVYLWKIYNG